MSPLSRFHSLLFFTAPYTRLQLQLDGEPFGKVAVVEQIENVVRIHRTVLVVVRIVMGAYGITLGEVYVEQKIDRVVFGNRIVFVYVSGDQSQKTAFVAGDVLFAVVNVIGGFSGKRAVGAVRVAGVVKRVGLIGSGS